MLFNLEKGQKFDLRKEDGTSIKNACIGINWGAITEKGFFGTKTKSVDLDASCILFDENKVKIDEISYRSLRGGNGAIVHSGDDTSGDTAGNDGLDNEVISVDFEKLPTNTQYVAFILNSFNSVPFGDIPYSSIRIYDGTPKIVNEVYAKFDVTSNPDFSDKYGMVLGVFYKRNNEWKFNAIGNASVHKRIDPLVTETVNYL